MLLTEAIGEFSSALRADGRSFRTVDNYIWQLSIAPANVFRWLRENKLVVTLRAVRVGHLRDYINWLRESYRSERTGALLAHESVSDFIRSLHRFFSWCSGEYGIDNPMHRIAFPRKIEQPPKAIALSDVLLLLSECDSTTLAGIRDAAIVLFLLDTGCRAAGLCGLDDAEVDMMNRIAIVREKGERTRALTFTPRTARALLRWQSLRAQVKPLFYNLNFLTRLTTNGLSQMLLRLGERAHVQGKVNPHAFRHRFAVEWVLRGGDPVTLAALLGHRSVQTTLDNYVRLSPSDLFERHARYSAVISLEDELKNKTADAGGDGDL